MACTAGSASRLLATPSIQRQAPPLCFNRNVLPMRLVWPAASCRKSAWVETSDKYKKLGVLFDAGPDMWGRTVVRHQTGVANPAESALLLMGRGNGVGALLFSRTPALSRADLPAYGNLPTIEHDLLRVHQAAQSVFNAVPLP